MRCTKKNSFKNLKSILSTHLSIKDFGKVEKKLYRRADSTTSTWYVLLQCSWKHCSCFGQIFGTDLSSLQTETQAHPFENLFDKRQRYLMFLNWTLTTTVKRWLQFLAGWNHPRVLEAKVIAEFTNSPSGAVVLNLFERTAHRLITML